MGDIVNLRRVRKARKRAAIAEAAARNRASFGRSKAERAAAGEEAERRDAALDAHRLSTVAWDAPRCRASLPPEHARVEGRPGDTTGE